MGGQGDDGTWISLGSQAAGRVIAVQDRHLHIHQNHVEGHASVDGRQRFVVCQLAIADDRHVGAGLLQDERDEALIVRSILGQQDSAREVHLGRGGSTGFDWTVASSTSCVPIILTPATLPVSNVTLKQLPLPGALVTVMLPPSISANRLLIISPRPVPPNLRVVEVVRLTERLEQTRQLLGSQADSGVDDVDSQQSGRVAADSPVGPLGVFHRSL